MAKKLVGKRIDGALSQIRRLPLARGGPETHIERIGTTIDEVIAELTDPAKGASHIHIKLKIKALKLLRIGVKSVCSRWVIVHSVPKDLERPVARRRPRRK